MKIGNLEKYECKCEFGKIINMNTNANYENMNLKMNVNYEKI